MKVLFATDGTKHGAAASEMVKKLALGDGDSIHVISVVDMAVPMSVDIYGGYLPDTTELEKAAKENARLSPGAVSRLRATSYSVRRRVGSLRPPKIAE